MSIEEQTAHMNALLRRNPDAEVKDLTILLNKIEEARKEQTDRRKFQERYGIIPTK
jgi:hypothetical protein